MSVILEPVIVLPAIQVQIGDLKVSALLSTAGFSSIHEKVFAKIFEETDGNETMKDVKYIELNIAIDGHPITIELSVVPDLFVDMVLGPEFLYHFKVMLHFGLRSLKWDCEGKVVITKMLESDESLRAVSGGCGKHVGQKLSNGSAKQQIDERTFDRNDKDEHLTALDYVTDSVPSVSVVLENNCTSGKPQGKKSRKKSNKAQNNASASNRAMRKDWVKVYVVDLFFVNKYSGDYMGFYAIWWGENHQNNSIDSVCVDEKTGDGVHLDALEYIFQRAIEGKIKNLHILSSNPTVMDAMKAYQDNDELKLSNLKPGSCEEFSYENEYKIYTQVCQKSKKIKRIKYEYVYFEEKCSEMTKLREQVWDKCKFQALVDFHYQETPISEFSENSD